MMAWVTRRPLTILHTEASLGWGGQEHRIVAETQIMEQRGHKILIAADPRGQLAGRGQRLGLPVLPVKFGGRDNIVALLTIRRIIKEHSVDILNTHSSLDSWLGTLAVQGRRQTKLVRTRHLSTSIRTNWPTRWLYQRPDALITTGEAIKTIIQERAGVPPARIVSIPTGVSLERFSPHIPGDRTKLPAAWPLAAPIIGSVAVLRSWKGHLYLLEAVQRLRQCGLPVRLLLVGEGPYREVLEAKIAELGLLDVVFLPGYQEDVPSWLALMDLFVLASYANEGVPQALLQAMAMAKPVVGTRCGGIPEIIRPQENGLLVPPRDSEALAAAIQKLLETPELQSHFGAKGLELVRARYSLEKMGESLEAVYAQVCGSN